MNIKPEERYSVDYPKLNELINLKTEVIKDRRHPPVYIK